MIPILFISGQEIVVVLFIVLLLFGAKSIPDVARMLGKGMNEFRRASEDIKKEFKKESGGISDDLKDIKKTFKN